MMMLEIDYMTSFNEPYTDGNPSTLSFGNLSVFFLVVFVLLMPILLMNLLVCVTYGRIFFLLLLFLYNKIIIFKSVMFFKFC